MKKLSAVLALAVVLTAFSACSADSRYSDTYLDLFDTVTEFAAYLPSKEAFDAASKELRGELKRLNDLFDAYSDHEGVINLKTINDNAGRSAVFVGTDSDLLRLVEFGKEEYARSGGKLNIAMGAVTRIWRECMQTGVLPDADALNSASVHSDIENVVVSDGYLYLDDPEMLLDVGAIAKGYAASRAVRVLTDMGVTNFALNIGGNTVTSGKKPNGNWKIGIQDPDGGILTSLGVSGVSVVTSGDYQMFVEIDKKRYHHIIDPDTLYPSDNFRAVTVICPDHAKADALSTELFLLDVESGKKLLKECGAEAIWVFSDGTAVRTEGFSKYE